MTCEGWREGVDTGDPVPVCTYTSGHVEADAQEEINAGKEAREKAGPVFTDLESLPAVQDRKH